MARGPTELDWLLAGGASLGPPFWKDAVALAAFEGALANKKGGPSEPHWIGVRRGE